MARTCTVCRHDDRPAIDQATLDCQEARAGDLAVQIAAANAREAIIRAAIDAGRLRMADAELHEARAQLTAGMREHAALLARPAGARQGGPASHRRADRPIRWSARR